MFVKDFSLILIKLKDLKKTCKKGHFASGFAYNFLSKYVSH